MDTSKRFIDMCTLAWELQDDWVPLPWDYIFCRVDHTVTCITPYKPQSDLNCHYFDGNLIHGPECCGSKREHIWLPRMDQLTSRLIAPSTRIAMFLYRFSCFAHHKHAATCDEATLRYYMHIRASKIWYRDQWIHKVTAKKYGYKS